MQKYRLNNQLDALDTRIINELTVNARIGYSQLAKNLNVSNSLVHQRIKKLEESGVLGEAQYRLSPDKLGYETCAFTQIIIGESKFLYSIIHELESVPEIVECVNIVGRYAIMVKIYAVNNTHLRDIVYEKIQSIQGVTETNTLVTFETNFMRSLKLKN